MSHSTGRKILVVGVMLIAGCSGFVPNNEPTDSGPQQLRFVVQNDVSSAETITLIFTSDSGEMVLNETETVNPDSDWVVSTLNVSDLETPVTVTAHMPDRNYTNELTPIRSTDRGSRLHTIYDDGINIYECNTNVTCWQQPDV